MMTKMTLLKYLPWLMMLCGLGGNALGQGAAPADPAPSFYQESGISRTREYINQHDAEHIDPFTGKLQYHFVDLFIPGNGGMDLKLQRSYNSVGELIGLVHEITPMGLGWTMHFGRMLKPFDPLNPAYICNQNLPILELSDGSRRIFYNAINSASGFISTDFWKAECGTDPQVAMVFYSPDGTQYEVRNNGHVNNYSQISFNVSKITDRNGNWIKINYQYLPNTISAIKSVTTSDGRALIFEYGIQGSALAKVTNGIVDGSGFATKDGGDGRIVEYVQSPVESSYTFLKEAILPNGEKWKFEYQNTPGSAGHYSMRQILQPTGGKIDYIYSFIEFGLMPGTAKGTSITKKTATKTDLIDGQLAAPTTETWTYQYLPATERLLISIDQLTGDFIMHWKCTDTLASYAGLDRTIISGPNGAQTLGHFGYNSISSGFVHTIGVNVCTVQAEQIISPTITSIQISNIPLVGPSGSNASDSDTSAILSTGQFIGRFGESFTTTFSNFDSYGNPRTITEVGSNTKVTDVTYNIIPSKWIIRQRKNETATEGIESLSTTRTFDSNGNMLNETHAGVTTSYTYNANGDIASKKDALLKTTQYSNYHRGIARAEQQPGNVFIARVVSDAGNITSETDGEGATTSFSYDALNRVTGIAHPIGNPVSVVWTQNTRTVTRGSYIAETRFDSFGREVRVEHKDTYIDPNRGPSMPLVKTYMVDSLGRRTFESYPNSTMGTKTNYDLLNRPTLIFNEYLPAMNGNGDSYVSFQSNSYRNFGVRRKNERDIYMFYKYRTYGNPDKTGLLEVSENYQSPTQANVFFNLDTYVTINRNIAGQMTSVVQNGVNRLYGYNTNNFLVSVTEPETGVTTMGRDAIGNLASRQVENSAITTYSYDDRNRLVGIVYPAGTPSVVKTYFNDDKLKSIDNGVAKRDYIYDANKNLTNETLTIGAKVFPLAYGYNANDAHTFIRYGSNKIVNYAPDAFGRPTRATPYVSSVAYHPSGQVSNYTFANGVASTINLNERQWPNSLKIARTNTLFDIYYGYDYVGNVTSINDGVDSSYDKYFGYDHIDRLIQINGVSQSIHYSLSGDITAQRQDTGTLTYQYDGIKRRLLNVSGTQAYAMQYDIYGNTINNGKNVFSYNDASHMKCANCGFTNEVLYEYDGNGVRVKSRKNNTDTFYMYGFSGQLLWEETPNTSLKEYIYLGGKQIATREQILP
jgi:YD repeat-containing protein